MVPQWLWLLQLATGVDAHIAMWHKAMFGLNTPKQASDSWQNYNNNLPVVPLRHSANLTTEQWFGHGLKGYPPRDGDFMELESGGTFTGELSCNRAWTTLRNPNMNDKPVHHYACPDVGPMHVNNKFGEEPDPQYFGGTSLAIAYTSDVDALKPTDMTVISVNYTSVWTRETEYPIPCGLPPCPPGGCLCTWNWIHQCGHGEGYGMEIYNNLYRCNVTGQTNPKMSLPIGAATIPVICEKDPSICIKGPKQPMYVYMKEGNNMPWPWAPPTYNSRFGFHDGAQNDLFNDIACPDETTPAVPVPPTGTPSNISHAQGEAQAVFEAPGGTHAEDLGAANQGAQAVLAVPSSDEEAERIDEQDVVAEHKHDEL